MRGGIDELVDSVVGSINRTVTHSRILYRCAVCFCEANCACSGKNVACVNVEAVELVFRAFFDLLFVSYKRAEVCIGNGFLLVAEHLEFFKAIEKLFIGKVIAEVVKSCFESVLTGVLAENDLVCCNANAFGRHDLVCLTVCKHAVLVNTGFVSESVCAYDGLVERGCLTDDVIYELGCVVKSCCVYARGIFVDIGACTHCHNNLFKRSVAGALAETVYRTFDLRCAAENACKGVGNAETEVVVAVNGEIYHICVFNVRYEIFDKRAHFRGGRVANRIGNVDSRRAGADSRVYYLSEKCGLASRCVLCGKFYVRAVVFRICNELFCFFKHLLLCHTELVLHVEGGGCDENVDSGVHVAANCCVSGIYIFYVESRKRSNRAIMNSFGNAFYGLEISGRGYCKACLDNVNFEFFKCARNFELFLEVHAAAGGLFTVAQRGIENFNLFHVLFLLCF